MAHVWMTRITVLLFIVAVGLSVVTVYVKHQHRQLYSELYRLRTGSEELLLLQSQLLLESSTLASYSRIESVAQSQLHMHAPEAWEVLWLNPTGSQ